MKNKKIVLSFLICALLVGIIFLNKYGYDSLDKPLEIKTKNDKVTLAMYQIGDDGTETSIEEVPSDGVYFLSSKSYCENGSKIFWDNDTKKINVKTNKSDKCYIYFNEANLAGDIISRATNSNKLYSEAPEYATVSANTSGLYKMEDDLGISYYFRGDVATNYVKFGSYAAGSTVNGVTYDVETPIYWRIVRINGDGTIRLIYDGVEKVENGVAHDATIGNSAYYSYSSNLNYPGYLYGSESDPYGNENDSEIKTALETWYANNLEETYGKYVADSIFCNDREVESTNDWGVRFKSYNRLVLNLQPQLTCTQKTDRFTVDNKTGNKALSKPVGLITADEMVFAGLPGVYTSDGMDYAYNNTFYLANGGNYWTMTPNNYAFTDIYSTQVFFVSNNWNGSTNTSLIDNDNVIDGVSASRGIRPVINLRADVEFSGTGEFDSPYEIVLN